MNAATAALFELEKQVLNKGYDFSCAARIAYCPVIDTKNIPPRIRALLESVGYQVEEIQLPRGLLLGHFILYTGEQPWLGMGLAPAAIMDRTIQPFITAVFEALDCAGAWQSMTVNRAAEQLGVLYFPITSIFRTNCERSPSHLNQLRRTYQRLIQSRARCTVKVLVRGLEFPVSSSAQRQILLNHLGYNIWIGSGAITEPELVQQSGYMMLDQFILVDSPGALFIGLEICPDEGPELDKILLDFIRPANESARRIVELK